eukprot:TRINITY_DN4426_c3_g1_i4.p1 TRINITY_DN4426_c3_g1~~TRINITY_DN4426_c3_g1_i4.p1  ORF type:complete len:172 (+),score=43.84 TRINITY_DN4426_c3_g1_i4:34-549(+)
MSTFVKDSFEGLLEGHESGAVKVAYKFAMFTIVVLTLVGCILPMVAPETCGVPYILSACLVCMLLLVLTMIRWHRVDGRDAKNKKLIYCFMLVLFLLDIYSITLHEVVPDTSCPAAPPTPTPAPPCIQPCLRMPTNDQCLFSVHSCFEGPPIRNCSVPTPHPTPAPTTPPR